MQCPAIYVTSLAAELADWLSWGKEKEEKCISEVGLSEQQQPQSFIGPVWTASHHNMSFDRVDVYDSSDRGRIVLAYVGAA